MVAEFVFYSSAFVYLILKIFSSPIHYAYNRHIISSYLHSVVPRYILSDT